jgi:hypothetical protein
MKTLLAVIAIVAFLAPPAISDEPPLKHSEFVFARLQVPNRADYLQFWDEAPWHHDYPYSDEFFIGMVRELTGIHVNPDSYRIVQISSPEIFRYPFLYFSEPGFMVLNEKEIANLGEYIRRGGFIMCDDFRTANYLHGPEELDVLRSYLKRAVPEFELVKLDIRHPIFHSFYDIDTLKMEPPYGREPGKETPGFIPEFWGLSDQKGNLRLIANYNNDLGEFWKWVDQGKMPFRPAKRSVELGINYLVYAMSH